jgi:hypothetical protein
VTRFVRYDVTIPPCLLEEDGEFEKEVTEHIQVVGEQKVWEVDGFQCRIIKTVEVST